MHVRERLGDVHPVAQRRLHGQTLRVRLQQLLQGATWHIFRDEAHVRLDHARAQQAHKLVAPGEALASRHLHLEAVDGIVVDAVEDDLDRHVVAAPQRPVHLPVCADANDGIRLEQRLDMMPEVDIHVGLALLAETPLALWVGEPGQKVTGERVSHARVAVRALRDTACDGMVRHHASQHAQQAKHNSPNHTEPNAHMAERPTLPRWAQHVLPVWRINISGFISPHRILDGDGKGAGEHFIVGTLKLGVIKVQELWLQDRPDMRESSGELVVVEVQALHELALLPPRAVLAWQRTRDARPPHIQVAQA
mmetsp:Transcript_25044/g.65003  ORF Transcript_25044/g.65003 Transcript_25044/m.65003 type:complete len:308 (-) Transcript_25044:676-1599(-)